MLKKIINNLKRNSKNPKLVGLALAVLRKNNPQDSSFEFKTCLRTALIIQQMGLDDELITAALLAKITPNKLSSIKDSPDFKGVFLVLKKFQQLKGIFNFKIILKKKPLKKWRKIALDLKAENIRKMFFVLSQDLKPVFLMIAFALDEMRHLNSFKKQERARKSLEALEIFSPLAYSLGALKIKGEFEDLAFPQLYFKEYQWLIKNIKEKTIQLEVIAKKMEPIIAERLGQEKIEVLEIESRGKHLFSLYQKLLRYNMDIEKIYDLVALRVIVKTIEDCYKALGIIHKSFRPLEGRIKDYIAKPKQNGYQALQTTVFCQNCQRYIEVQIKTEIMHKSAEYGYASHLIYKQPNSNLTSYNWMNQLRKWQEETKEKDNLKAFLENDIFKNKIFVFTPKQEIIELPKGATPLDFAYAIHSDIGEHCQSAKVNGKMVSLNKTLQTGQMVEILTNKNKSPSFDWLRIVKTQRAKNKIKEFFEKVKGISFKKEKEITNQDQPADNQKQEESGFKKSIRGTLSFLGKIIPKKKEDNVLIGKQTGIAYKIAKCCEPKKGDEIVAFLIKGEPASVHKKTCKNFLDLQKKFPPRVIEAEFA